MIRVLLTLFVWLGTELLSGQESEHCSFAIAVSAYKRPDYLKEVLIALRKNKEVLTTPVYLFCDGGSDATIEENVKVARELNFPHLHIVARDSNWGCPKNLIGIRRRLFEEEGYELLFVLEDDTKISKDCIGLMLRAYTWVKEHIENLGTLTAWSGKQIDKVHKRELLDVIVERGRQNHWAYLIDKECWDEIKGIYYDYERRFLGQGGVAHYMNQGGIHKWRRKLLIEHGLFSTPFGRSLGGHKWGTGQDSILDLALFCKDLTSSCLLVNRVVNIGKEGLNYNSEIWERLLGIFSLDEFEEDCTLDTFFLFPVKREELP